LAAFQLFCSPGSIFQCRLFASSSIPFLLPCAVAHSYCTVHLPIYFVSLHL
jgi:hypothetical protein